MIFCFSKVGNTQKEFVKRKSHFFAQKRWRVQIAKKPQNRGTIVWSPLSVVKRQKMSSTRHEEYYDFLSRWGSIKNVQCSQIDGFPKKSSLTCALYNTKACLSKWQRQIFLLIAVIWKKVRKNSWISKWNHYFHFSYSTSNIFHQELNC